MHDEHDAEDGRLAAVGDIEGLLARYIAVIDARCRARVREPHDAQDVAQAALYRLFNELKAGKTYPVPFRAVVHNVVGWTIGAHFAQQRNEPIPLEWDAPVDGGYAAIDERLTLDALFAGLSEREQRIFTLRYLDGVEIEQIAEQFGMQRNAVDQALYRGHKKLGELIA